MKELLGRLSWQAVFACVAAAVLAIAYWASDRTPPVFVVGFWADYHGTHPGETLTARFVVYRTRSLPTRYEQAIVDGSGVRYPQAPLAIEAPRLGVETFALDVVLPPDVGPGPAEYQVTLLWRRPLNLVDVFWPIRMTLADRFVIVPPAEEGAAGEDPEVSPF